MFSRKFLIIQGVFLSLALILGIFYLNQNRPEALPTYGAIQDFSLKNQHGHLVTLKDLKGKVWVADFIFTTCGGICPVMTKAMSGLNETFAKYNDIKMVSISVNPESDTPQKLKAYADKQEAKGENWIFLTGEREQIQKLVVESFKMGDIKEIVFHSALFALVDRKGYIRGYYEGTDKDRVLRLQDDLERLRKE
jgi:protein SCO1